MYTPLSMSDHIYSYLYMKSVKWHSNGSAILFGTVYTVFKSSSVFKTFSCNQNYIIVFLTLSTPK